MGDDSERLHLEGLDEATERERWEEHHAAPTDLPDAVEWGGISVAEDSAVVSAIRPEHRAGLAAKMLTVVEGIAKRHYEDGFAAVSGPWAEHLLARIAELEKEVHIGEEMIEQQHKELKAEEMHADPDAGCVVCDPLMIQEVIDERDAALARNAELQAEVDEWKSEADDQRGAFVWANGACQEQATQKWAAIAERDALRAELDNLRDRVTAWEEAGYDLWRPYGDDCETCGTQSEASIVRPTVILDGSLTPVRGSDDEA